MKNKKGPALLIALFVGLFAAVCHAISLLFEPFSVRELTSAINTHGTYAGGIVSRVTEAAFGSPYLVCRKGSADRQILVGTATARPLGTVCDSADSATQVGVRVFGQGDPQVMVGAAAITVDSPVYTSASGKVTSTPTAGCWLVGVALTACSGDGAEFLVATCAPVQVTSPVVVSTADAAVTAAQAIAGVFLSNAGAAGAVTFALPAAVVGMRVTAIVEVAQELRLDPNGTETIALPSTGVQGAAGKYLTADAVAERVQLVCVTAGTWDVVDYAGTWTAEA